uniref:Uncharacterized protein n=1 Tax=Pseudomonas phage RVTF4 TaxID=3236931 RepID=A0AB39CD53_9VIRU
MCHKLGKKKLKQIFGNQYGIDLRRDKEGKIRRNRWGRRMGTNYMSKILAAWQGLDRKFMPDQNNNGYKLTKAKRKQLVKLDNLYIYGQAHQRRFTSTERKKRIVHLERNNVCRVLRNVDMAIPPHQQESV